MSPWLDIPLKVIAAGWSLNILSIVCMVAYLRIKNKYESRRDDLPLLFLFAISWVPFLTFFSAIVIATRSQLK